MTALHLLPDQSFDFDDAVARLRPRLQRYASRRLGDRDGAEELVQEALLRACSQVLASEDELAAWCHVVTSRLVMDRLRVSGRTVSVPEVPEGHRQQRDTADIVVARDEARTALDALDALIPRQAAVLWAREVEGASYDEIGARFAMSEPAVRSLLTRARKALRQEYARRGGTLPHAGLALLAPWAGLHGLRALHRVATRGAAVTGTAMGVAAFGALALLPSQPATADPARPGDVAVMREAVSSAEALGRGPVPAVTDVVQPAAVRVTTARTPPAARRTALAAVTGVCASTRGAGAGGSDCVKQRTTYVFVRTPAPLGAAAPGAVGVRTNDYDCQHFPDNPVVTCRTGEQR